MTPTIPHEGDLEEPVCLVVVLIHEQAYLTLWLAMW